MRIFARVPWRGASNNSGVIENVDFQAFGRYGNEAILGVTLDSTLSMNRHVTEVVRSCSYHTRALRHIRPLLTLGRRQVCRPQHRLIATGLCQRNAVWYTSAGNLHRLQVAQKLELVG